MGGTGSGVNLSAGDTITYCGICGTRIATMPQARVYMKAGLAVLEAPSLVWPEDQCRAHYTDKHPVRYRLWQRFGWRWLLAGR